MKYVWYILVAVAFLALGFLGGKAVSKPVAEPVVQIDTLIRVDTLRVEKPVYITEEVVRTDTVTLHTVDSVLVEVQVPIVEKVYADSTYKAQVSGYNPSLDWIEVYPKTTTITIKETTQIPPKKFGFDVTAGPTAVYNGKITGGLGITWGISYRF